MASIATTRNSVPRPRLNSHAPEQSFSPAFSKLRGHVRKQQRRVSSALLSSATSVTFRAQRSVSIPCPEVQFEMAGGVIAAPAGHGAGGSIAREGTALPSMSGRGIVDGDEAGREIWRDGEDERRGNHGEGERQRGRELGRSVVPVRVRVRVEEYLRQVERVVRVCFPDSKRLRFLGGDSWRATLRPVTFFSFSAVPSCTVRVWSQDGSLFLHSSDLHLDFTGVPPSLSAIPLSLSVDGHLQRDKHEARTRTHARTHAHTRTRMTHPNTSPSPSPPARLCGRVAMQLRVELPPPLRVLPPELLSSVGDALLDGILAAMQAALMTGLTRDYTQWAKEQARGEGAKAGRVNAAAAAAAAGVAAGSSVYL